MEDLRSHPIHLVQFALLLLCLSVSWCWEPDCPVEGWGHSPVGEMLESPVYIQRSGIAGSVCLESRRLETKISAGSLGSCWPDLPREL